MGAPDQTGHDRELMSAADVSRTIARIAHQIIEKTALDGPDSPRVILLGIPTRGVTLATRLARNIADFSGVDVATGALVKQAPPNDGILNTVGMLGGTMNAVAFDIWSDGTKNEAWAMTGADLWSVDLATGKASPAAKIEGIVGTVKDIAILPAM